jgi:hypothetical protein
MKAQGKYTHVTSHGPGQTYVANPLHNLGDHGYGEQSMGADEVDVSLPAGENQLMA